MLEVRPGRIRGATPHGVEVTIRLEINADRPDQRRRHIRTRRPASLCTTTSNIDQAGHTENTMCNTVVRILTRRLKCVRVNSAGVGKSTRKAASVVGRTILRIGNARRTAAHAMATALPGPSHRVADGNVDAEGMKREIRAYRHIERLPKTRWHAVHRGATVLIDDPQRRFACIRRSHSLLTGFGAYQNSERKNGCSPKNQPCCIRYFHTVGLFYAPASDILCRIAADALRSGAGDIARRPATKASRIFNLQAVAPLSWAQKR